MRSISFVLFFVACSDYDMVAHKSEGADSPPTDVTDVVPVDEPDTNDEDTDAEDTDLEPSEECPGYVIFSGFYELGEGGSMTPQYAAVESRMLFSLIGDTEIEVAEGEDVIFNVAATTLACGATQLHTIFPLVQDIEGNSWMVQLNDDRVESGYLTEMSTGTEFPAIAPDNLNNTRMGDELHYEWCAEELGGAGCADIATRDFDAGDADVYTFRFSPGEYAPAGTTFEIHLNEVIWTDVTSGELIREYFMYDVYITVTVV